MTQLFSDADIDTFDERSSTGDQPSAHSGASAVPRRGIHRRSQPEQEVIDVVRTIDSINFLIKAELIQAIGNFRVSSPGCAGLSRSSKPSSAASGHGGVEDFSVHIPLLVLLDKDRPLSAAD